MSPPGQAATQAISSVGGFLRAHLTQVGFLVVVVVAVIVLHGIGVVFPNQSFIGGSSSAAADIPPIEYAYLDSARVAAYLGQLENGLPASEQRSQQLTESINASLSAGTAAQVGASQQAQQATQVTVTPTAADRFYMFLRALRSAPMATCRVTRNDPNADGCNPSGCNTTGRTRWLADINDQSASPLIMGEVQCAGVGNFVRLTHAQLFVPPFGQALSRAASANAFYGELPSPRTAFTSLTQLAAVRAGLDRYSRLVGPDPRVPFVAAPYGFASAVGSGATFFLPVRYLGLTAEPALLSGDVTIVGKIIYYAAKGGPAYIDYPTISQFGQPLGVASRSFLDALGVCSSVPPPQIRAGAHGHTSATPKGSADVGQPVKPTGSCTSHQRALDAVKASVTLTPPIVVLLPLAIFQ
jgi:hypothetical protein